MMTKVSFLCLVALVCAHFCSTLSEGAIFPCSKNDTQFRNRTLLAWMGGTASFKFCAESSVRVFGWINISHPNHRDGWYPQPVGLEERLDAQVEIYHHTATVTIKLNKLQPADFNEPFAVTLFAADENGTRINDTSAFFFVIEETDPSSGDGSLILSTQPTMPAITSIRTELSTMSLQANNTSTSTVSPTQQITQCWPHKTSQCPENWYQVDNETCLLVTRMSNNESASDVCNEHGSEPVWRQDMKKLRSCLIKILGKSKGASDNYVVRLDRTYYVNVQNGSEATGNGTYSVVCASRTIKPPTISLFTLQIYTETGWSLVDNSTDYVTVKTPYADLALTCEAEGVPKPLVIVTDESGDKIRTRIPFRIDVCRRAGVYTCTAINALGRSQAHRRIRILSRLKVKFSANNNRRAEIRSGDTVELKCSVDGCPDRVTISSNARSVAETVNYTLPLVHEITRVNCSHMGTYACLAKSLTDQNVQETADLEVKGCPVSLCESDDASREMSPILGENVTISICVMSSEGLTFSANETKIVVKFTRNPITRVYWTVNITMNDIEVEDYRTHTVRIANSYGSLDVHFTLTDKDTSKSTFEFESNTLLIVLPPICFIMIVFIIAGIVWYRVKGAHTARLRAEETDASDASWEDTKGAGHYENISPEMVPNEENEEAAGIPYESIILNTDGMEELSQAEYVEIDDVQHETPVKGIDRKKPTSHVHSSEADYANIITHL